MDRLSDAMAGIRIRVDIAEAEAARASKELDDAAVDSASQADRPLVCSICTLPSPTAGLTLI